MQQVPGSRTCNRKRPTAEDAAMASWHDKVMAAGRSELLTMAASDVGQQQSSRYWEATPLYFYSEFVMDLLINIQPVQLRVKQACKAAVELPR